MSLKYNNTIRPFFALLRAGLIGKPADCRLFLHLNEEHWEGIFRLSVNQAITAITWDGMLTLPKDLQPHQTIWYKWLGNILTIEKTNARLNSLLPEVLNLCAKADRGTESQSRPVVLLKGQGTAALYPNPSHRTPGDIDIYPGKKYALLEKLLPKMGFERIKHSTKHSEYRYKEVIVENHRYIALFFHPWSAWKLSGLVNEWFPGELQTRKVGEEKILVLPPWFETLFGVIHFRAHLHLEGVGWRQLCDWAIIKRQVLLKDERNNKETMRYTQGLCLLGLKKIEAIMEELFETLVVQNEDLQTLSPMARKIYEEMLKGGNFGQQHYTENAQTHLYANQKGFWPTLWDLAVHDMERSIRFFSLFPGEAIFSPLFRIGGYIRRRGK